MIGNDVIDLDLAKKQSNWQRKGYLDKIFTKKEQNFISNSENSTLMVWNLWSRKEAVYKIIIQNNGKRGYYPLKIECLNTNFENGVVCFENIFFYTKTLISKHYIHTLALKKSNQFYKINYIKKKQVIEKNNEIPFLKQDDKLFSASKSHHGKFEKGVCLQS